MGLALAAALKPTNTCPPSTVFPCFQQSAVQLGSNPFASSAQLTETQEKECPLRVKRLIVRFLCLGVALALSPQVTVAQSFWERTDLASLSLGSPLSDRTRAVSLDSYLLSTGAYESFAPLYGTGRRTIRALFRTDIGAKTEGLWGFATPESAPSYDLSAGLSLGLTHRIDIDENRSVTLMVLFRLGEWLSEDSCTADYGAIGGAREVNCRLSGSPLPPEETLDYLWEERTPDWGWIRFAYTIRF